MSTVSVLIPTYNRASVLKRAVDSVLKQSLKDLECIVIDDASTDNSLEVLNSYTDERLKIVTHEKNGGVSKARNTGFSHSKGKWIALLDSDDEWLPHRLKAQLALAKEMPQVPLIHGEEVWVRNGKRVNQKKIHQKSGGKIFNRCLHLCLISPSATLMKRELFEELKGFREDYPVCEDYEMWLRVTARYSVGFVEAPIITKYGGHEDQLSAKYKAMDYWRVLAMDELFRNEEFPLEKDQVSELREVLTKKCEILLAGYKKHNNLKDFETIEELLSRYQSLPLL